MQTLLVEVDGRVLRLDAARTYRVGRSIDADVVLSAMSVSRVHAELRPGPSGWVLADAGSAGGTYVNGSRVTELPVSGRLEVQCGPPAPGSTLVITPEEQAAADLAKSSAPAPAPPPPAPGQQPAGFTPPPPYVAPDQVVPPPPYQPGGYPAAPQPGGPPPYDPHDTMVVGAGQSMVPGQPPQQTGPDLLVIAEGVEHRFRHPAQISIGRLPSCDVVIDDPEVSRLHGQVSAVPGKWVYQNASDHGTYAKGRQITQESFDESLAVRLGHPVAGPEVSLVPIYPAEVEMRRIAQKRTRRRLLVGGIGVLALVLVAGVVLAAYALLRDEGLTAAEADDVKAATVFILTPDPSMDGTIAATGSGSLLTDDGKILTNAHVADPGLIPEIGMASPEFVLVALTDPGKDYVASEEAVYKARVIASDGERDAAVVQIYETADGKAVDPADLDLPTMPMGDSGDVEQGDHITVFGFPGIASSEEAPEDASDLFRQVTQTGGSVATIVTLDGDPRGVFDVDARIAGGNSGGAMVDDDGELVGVPTRIKGSEEGGPVSGRVSPLDFLSDTLAEAGVEVP